MCEQIIAKVVFIDDRQMGAVDRDNFQIWREFHPAKIVRPDIRVFG